jgi:hypothetical protein
MSTIKADTVQNTSGGPVTLTNQEATKHWVNYDAVAQVTRGSLNQSSLTDHSAGTFTSNFSNSFSSATDKCHVFGYWDTYNSGSGRAGGTERGGGGQVQRYDGSSSSSVKYEIFYGSSGSSDGGVQDVNACYATSIGDLA